MSFINYLQESADKDKTKKMTIVYNSPNDNLLKLIEHIKKVSNVGNSFTIVVDLDDEKKNFDWDGDADTIDDVSVEIMEQDDDDKTDD